MAIHFLIVDDEADLEYLYMHYLNRWIDGGSAKMSFADSAPKALEILQSNEGKDISVVLTDINMPNFDGFSLSKQIKAFKPAIDVIFVSGYSDQKHKDQAMSLSGLAYFEKPIDFDELLRFLEKKYPALSIKSQLA